MLALSLSMEKMSPKELKVDDDTSCEKSVLGVAKALLSSFYATSLPEPDESCDYGFFVEIEDDDDELDLTKLPISIGRPLFSVRR